MTTVRTIKLKRSNTGPDQGSANTPGATSAPAADAAAQPAEGATLSRKSYLPYTLAASVVVILILVIMGLQYSEMSLYKAAPSVWVSPK